MKNFIIIIFIVHLIKPLDLEMFTLKCNFFQRKIPQTVYLSGIILHKNSLKHFTSVIYQQTKHLKTKCFMDFSIRKVKYMFFISRALSLLCTCAWWSDSSSLIWGCKAGISSYPSLVPCHLSRLAPQDPLGCLQAILPVAKELTQGFSLLTKEKQRPSRKGTREFRNPSPFALALGGLFESGRGRQNLSRYAGNVKGRQGRNWDPFLYWYLFQVPYLFIYLIIF